MSLQKEYNAENIVVLKGLDPVKRRPGMYTDTAKPNHLAQEVVDNSVDEALGGYATEIKVVLYEDQSIEVIDNGRGMPVDIHPTEKVPGVELIFCRLYLELNLFFLFFLRAENLTMTIMSIQAVFTV